MPEEIFKEGQPHHIDNRLEFFPIMMFAIVMGISGLTIAWQKAAAWLHTPHIINQTLVYIDSAVFIAIALTYIAKLLLYPHEVVAEWKHPVRINFFSAISISMLMLSIIFHDAHWTALARYAWIAGTAMHTFMTLYTISYWINHNQELNHSNPAWFIPIVGNVLVPVAGVGFAPLPFLMYYFSIGLFFWVILFAILLNRIIFHHQLPQKFMPTLFILLAPPAVAFIAYFKLYHQIDTFAMFLFDIALFFALMLVYMARSFFGLKFFISWWAFIFPVAAMAIASMVMLHVTKSVWMLYLSYGVLGAATFMTLIVLYQTLIHMAKGEICIQE
jgi:tellurite resistance protein